MKERLLKDMRNEKILAQVLALGVVGKVFSWPWMTKFYASNVTNLDMVSVKN